MQYSVSIIHGETTLMSERSWELGPGGGSLEVRKRWWVGSPLKPLL